MNEFELIERYLRPLAGPGALALGDDAAVIDVPAGEELVLTKDAIVAGIHFLADDPLDLVARKLMRVNISDLAAKGARPLGYLLACCWPRGTREADIALFCQGLALDQSVYGWKLLGGDTTASDGPLTLSLTALGTVAKGTMVKRSGARAGDHIYLTGTLGDAGLGLKVGRGGLEGIEGGALLLERYRLPEPRLAFALAARALMSAAIDVSDGLMADAGHIAEASGLALRLEASRLPFSAPAAAWLAGGGAIGFLASCGDDYEICFAAPPEANAALMAAAQQTGTRLTRIGVAAPGSGALLVAADGLRIEIAASGYRHF